jgi:Transposase DDE domain
VEQKGKGTGECGGDVETGIQPARLTGAFERYRRAVPERWVLRMLHGRAAFSREGPLSAWVVMWLMIFQRLDAKGTLSAAVRQLLTGGVRAFVCRPEGKPVEPLSANTSAYSQARSKLPPALIEKVSDMIFESLREQFRSLPGLELPMFLLDGTSIQLQHSRELLEKWPPARNQHGSSHWSVIRVVVAHDVISALAVRPCWGPMDGPAAVSEQGLTKEIMGRLPVGCGVLGDRNFGVFSMAWHAREQNHPCLFRLTELRAQKLNGRTLPPAGTDRKILWVPSREDRRANPEIPADTAVRGRLLAFKTRDARGQWQQLYFFTTLTPPPEQILNLYGYRWNIETDLRSLKREVRLHMPEARSADMVEKELLLGVAAYNLTRAAMNEAGAALGLDPRRFSFSQAQDTLYAFLPLFANAASDQEHQQITKQMLRAFGQSKLPKRTRRSYTREVWPRPCPFPKRKVATKGPAANKRNVA